MKKMDKTRQIYSEKQDVVTRCASGRLMVCINEEIIAATVATVMDEESHEGEEQKQQYAYDVYWLDESYGGMSDVEIVKSIKLDELAAYDKSPEVNSFYLNDVQVDWSDVKEGSPNRELRMSVRNGVNSCIAMKVDTYPLWLDGKCHNLPCETLIKMLDAVEVYAITCYNTTAQHKANISALTSIEEVLAYDYTTGYPDKLHF